MERAADIRKLQPSRAVKDMYKIAETLTPMLRVWLEEVHRARLMDGIKDICKAKGLDPETATVRQFMELK